MNYAGPLRRINFFIVLQLIMYRRIGQETSRGNSSAEVGDRRLVTHGRDGKLKSLLKKTYLSRWVGTPDFKGNEADLNSMEFVRFVNIFSVQ